MGDVALQPHQVREEGQTFKKRGNSLQRGEDDSPEVTIDRRCFGKGQR